MKRRSDYEWVNYIGGSCGLRHRKMHKVDAKIEHIEQDQYEAVLLRRDDSKQGWLLGEVSLGVFDTSEEAEATIEKVLEDIWEK